jgi:hypothetical protein
MSADNASPRHLSYAYLRPDGTGFYVDCPECHFFKNAPSDVGNPCRNALCRNGVVQQVEFVVTPRFRSEAKEDDRG